MNVRERSFPVKPAEPPEIFDSNGDGRLDGRVRVVADELEILEATLVDVLHRGIELRGWEWARLAGKLEFRASSRVETEVRCMGTTWLQEKARSGIVSLFAGHCMNYIGKIKNGVVVLPPDARLTEGQAVEVVVSQEPRLPDALHESAPGCAVATGLPDDLAANHDFYLHGTHKQQPRSGRWLQAGQPTPEMTSGEAAACTEQLVRFAAETRNLPPDLAANHDHYLHGLPRR